MAECSFDFPMWRASRIDAGLGMRSVSLLRRSLRGRLRASSRTSPPASFPLPDGFARGYTAEYNDVLVALDSRRPYPAEGSGVRLEAQAEQGSDVRQSPGSGWLHTAAGAGGFWDVTGNRRVISLSALAMFSDPLGSRPVPFTELGHRRWRCSLARARSPRRCRASSPGAWSDRSAAVATLRYKWPIAPVDRRLAARRPWATSSASTCRASTRGCCASPAPSASRATARPIAASSCILGFGTETFEHGAPDRFVPARRRDHPVLGGGP